ncbi:hypothetical protein K505DRAFT_335278 [Melanomma pulvis-pyrius CBS 109.77]|uniref:Uncharacterized protein n=1 Tax=Melanomma pulvis-pyrius CBS 109.77 TaxID=1314802 RepID=A0A6A6XJM0_9PLEO|nr:hypothetical protein K505DRAFT_335278 [Melanomma pulvis-pyrius CBS 109.77]
MAHVPGSLSYEPEPSFSVPQVGPATTLPPPDRHSKRSATGCKHDLHPSLPSHTPLCLTCILGTAQAKLEQAQERLLDQGGLDLSWALRDRSWVKARLAYYHARRGLEKAKKRDQLRWEREQAWDEAHLLSKFEQIDAGRQPDAETECSACSSMISGELEVPNLKIDNSLAWWDRPDAVARASEPKTPNQSRIRRKRPARRGSPTMHSIIHELRTALLTSESEQQLWEMRYKTEAAVRRKHHLGEGTRFEPTFWDSPISSLTSRNNHLQAQAAKRMAERHARGNAPRPRPPRSSLSHCESAEEFVVDEGLKEAMRLREEADELEREARRAGEDIGFLYFVGPFDETEKWRGDFVKSKHYLIWRNWTQQPGMEDDDEAEHENMMEYEDEVQHGNITIYEDEAPHGDVMEYEDETQHGDVMEYEDDAQLENLMDYEDEML